MHRARLAFVRRAAHLALRRTLGPTWAQRIIHALLRHGQAAAGDQGRSCDRTQQTYHSRDLLIVVSGDDAETVRSGATRAGLLEGLWDNGTPAAETLS